MYNCGTSVHKMEKESCSLLNSNLVRHAKEEKTASWGTAAACGMQHSRSTTMMMMIMAVTTTITTTTMAMVRVPGNNDRNETKESKDNYNNATINRW